MHTVCMQGTESATEFLHVRHSTESAACAIECNIAHKTFPPKTFPRAGGRENKISDDLETAARGSSSQACK